MTVSFGVLLLLAVLMRRAIVVGVDDPGGVTSAVISGCDGFDGFAGALIWQMVSLSVPHSSLGPRLYLLGSVGESEDVPWYDHT